MNAAASEHIQAGSVSPYVAGPTQALDPTDQPTAAEITPVVRLTGFATLTYDLPP